MVLGLPEEGERDVTKSVLHGKNPCDQSEPHEAHRLDRKTMTWGCLGVKEPIRRPTDASATRFKSNPNWSYRGDNTKYRETK